MPLPSSPAFETVRVEVDGAVARLILNRPQSANALDRRMWDEIPLALDWLGSLRCVRAAILYGEGKHFTAGIDLSVIDWLQGLVADPQRATRGREDLFAFIERAQHAFDAIETAPFPVIAAIHGACIGGGVDMIAACDLRLCTRDARFCVKEVDLAVVPDVGTIQRLRHIVGYSVVSELSYTAEQFDGTRALALRLVSRVCESQADLMKAAADLAATIAAKPPTTVRGIKRNLLWARDHSVRDGLAYVASWNAGMLVGEDLREALAAYTEKRAARYPD